MWHLATLGAVLSNYEITTVAELVNNTQKTPTA
jgi:hypothetical protein